MRAVGIVVAAVACMGAVALAQDGKNGSYQGKVSVSGSEIEKNKKTDFKATVKVSLPVEKKDGDATHAEVGDVEKPSAIATVTQWDIDARNTSPGADGKIATWKCSLAAPIDVPLNAQGALDVDHRARKYSMFVALVSTKPVALKCVHSQSGPYKTTMPVGFFFGTNTPDQMGMTALAYTDPARLVAKHRLTPSPSMGQYGPVDMEWELQLTK